MTAKIEAVLAKLKIDFEPKARQGRLWARCPYHEDNHPNWFIRVAPRERVGQHHCFACKNGGSLVALVSHVRGISFADAHAWLDEFDDHVPDVEPTPEVVRVVETKAPRGFQIPKEVIFEPLAEWVTPAREYMMNDRHVTNWQVEQHRLGYAVDGPLAGRIIIPVWDASWSPCCYHARDFCDREKRYLFPSTKDNPNLDALFGEHVWPAQRGQIVVTEGSFNALAVERALSSVHTNVSFAALGGSDFRAAHAFKLSSFSKVVLLTDSDPAGDKIADEINAAIVRHTQVKRLRLKDGDANDLPEWKLRALLRTVCE
jgi:DNA primase